MNAARDYTVQSSLFVDEVPGPSLCPLGSIDDLESLLRRAAAEGQSGELLLCGPTTARICLFEGKIAWVRLTDHPENLGHVMRRELGISELLLRDVITYCQASGRRFGEGMVALELITPHELRDCLYRHISDQLWELMTWSGPIRIEQSRWPHVYDHHYTFEFDELVRRPQGPTADEYGQIVAMLSRCRRQFPELKLACVIEAQEGTLLHESSCPDQSAEDLLSLCAAGLCRLANNRFSTREGSPEGMVFVAPSMCLVVQALRWHCDWLLVLAGGASPGRLLTWAAQLAIGPA